MKNTTKMLLGLHIIQTSLLVLGSLDIFFIGLSLGDEEQYTFFFPTISPEPTLFYVILSVVQILFILILGFGSLLQLPYGLAYWRQSEHSKAIKRVLVSLSLLLILVQLVWSLYYLNNMDDIILYGAGGLLITALSSYAAPWLFIFWTYPHLRQFTGFKFYTAFLLSHFIVYLFIVAYNFGAFPELRQSLAGFFDSYSKWK